MTYFCANCCALTELDSHLRCFRCQSDQVDIAVRPAVTAEGLASAYDWLLEEEMEENARR